MKEVLLHAQALAIHAMSPVNMEAWCLEQLWIMLGISSLFWSSSKVMPPREVNWEVWFSSEPGKLGTLAESSFAARECPNWLMCHFDFWFIRQIYWKAVVIRWLHDLPFTKPPKKEKDLSTTSTTHVCERTSLVENPIWTKWSAQLFESLSADYKCHLL